MIGRSSWMRTLTAVMVATLAANTASAALLVTEVYPGIPGPDGTQEWFEIFNNGNAAESVTGLFFDDESADPTVDDAINLVGGLTMLNPGDTLIVLNDAGADATDEINTFEAFWGISGLNYGFIDNGAGLNDDGDGVFVFDGNTAGANTVASLTYGSGAGSSKRQC